MKTKQPRIGLDIDEVLAGFMKAYYKYFDVARHPERLENHAITRNVQQVLSKDRDFWLNLEVINRIDFVPELYCTKRVCNKEWTRRWLIMNGFPDRPIYQLFNQSGNKGKVLKGRVDIFIDDSFSNVKNCRAAGIQSLLLHNEFNADIPLFKLYSLDYESIMETINFMSIEW